MQHKMDNPEQSYNYEARFSGVLGSDYNLFEKSVPWHEQFQNSIKRSLSEFCSGIQSPEIHVFEAGCGTGITTIRILDADSRIQVIAVDNEEATLRQARQVLQDFAARIEFKKEDLLEALEKCADGSCDAFASAYVIHNLPPEYRQKLFREIARVLRPGGLFLNADKYARDNPDEQRKDLEWQIKNFDVYDSLGRPDVKHEWTTHYYEDEKIKITEGEQKKILEQLGFKDIKTIFRERMEAIITAIK